MSAREFVEVDPRFRRRLEVVIEALIEVLDTLDGDPDLEDDELGDDETAA
jgi:hypothetical protein